MEGIIFIFFIVLMVLIMFGYYNIKNTENRKFKKLQIISMAFMIGSILLFVITLIKPVSLKYHDCLHGVILSSYEYVDEDDEYYYIHYSALFDSYTYCIEKSSSKKSALVSKGDYVNVFYNTEVTKPHQWRTIIKDAWIKPDRNSVFLVAGLISVSINMVIQVICLMGLIVRWLKKIFIKGKNKEIVRGSSDVPV